MFTSQLRGNADTAAGARRCYSVWLDHVIAKLSLEKNTQNKPRLQFCITPAYQSN